MLSASSLNPTGLFSSFIVMLSTCRATRRCYPPCPPARPPAGRICPPGATCRSKSQGWPRSRSTLRRAGALAAAWRTAPGRWTRTRGRHPPWRIDKKRALIMLFTAIHARGPSLPVFVYTGVHLQMDYTDYRDITWITVTLQGLPVIPKDHIDYMWLEND